VPQSHSGNGLKNPEPLKAWKTAGPWSSRTLGAETGSLAPREIRHLRPTRTHCVARKPGTLSVERLRRPSRKVVVHQRLAEIEKDQRQEQRRYHGQDTRPVAPGSVSDRE
jgi:hypothetical protein